MKSHHLLSNDQYEYLTSQTNDVPNPSEQRRRISEKVEQIFNTLKIIVISNKIEQEFKDKIFDPNKISYFIESLTFYDPESTVAQESNKQKIIVDLMWKVLTYFQSRYKETKFISKEIARFHDLAKDLEELAQREEDETEATIMYKTRKLPLPPLVYPKKDFWVSKCIYCFAYSSLGKNKEDSIKRIRHSRNCSFHKEMKRLGKKEKERVDTQFIVTLPPKDN